MMNAPETHSSGIRSPVPLRLPVAAAIIVLGAAFVGPIFGDPVDWMLLSVTLLNFANAVAMSHPTMLRATRWRAVYWWISRAAVLALAAVIVWQIISAPPTRW